MKIKSGTYDGLTYEDFKEFAITQNLSDAEKIGFTNPSRSGFEGHIIKDIINKLPNLNKKNQSVLDIGCGCGKLCEMLLEHCRQMENDATLVDSKEMLSNISDSEKITKISGKFPEEVVMTVESYDVIIVYSVFHYVLGNGCVYSFLDSVISLLKSGGQAIIADIPSAGKRKRFFSSDSGQDFIKKNFQNSSEFMVMKSSDNISFDDNILISLMSRARAMGVDAYIMPQNKNLFFANRREDLILYKP